MSSLLTLPEFISRQATEGGSGAAHSLVPTIVEGVIQIANLVSTAGLKGLDGYTGKKNVQGEDTQILDQASDEILIKTLGSSGCFGLLVSEEQESVIVPGGRGAQSEYVIAFDPLDGSSNLGSNIPVGTIFAVFRKRGNGDAPADMKDFLQSGRSLVAAGYAVYGSRTSLTYSCGAGVHSFILDPVRSEFFLRSENLRSPERGTIYSANEGNARNWHPRVRAFVEALKEDDKVRGTPYSARYAGSLVADFERNLHRGGIFIYPGDAKSPNGKLRLLYECMPLAFIAEQAGARAIDGTRNILDVVPDHIHQRSPLVVGSKAEVEWFEEWVK